MIYLVFQKCGCDHYCILATKSEEYAKQVLETMHGLDEPYIECIELEKIRDIQL